MKFSCQVKVHSHLSFLWIDLNYKRSTQWTCWLLLSWNLLTASKAKGCMSTWDQSAPLIHLFKAYCTALIHKSFSSFLECCCLFNKALICFRYWDDLLIGCLFDGVRTVGQRTFNKGRRCQGMWAVDIWYCGRGLVIRGCKRLCQLVVGMITSAIFLRCPFLSK